MLHLKELSRFCFLCFTGDGGVLSLTSYVGGEMLLLFSFLILFAGEPIISRGVSGPLLFEGGAAGVSVVFWFAQVMFVLVGLFRRY